MAEPVYRRVVIKLSGEYLAGSHSFGIDQPTVDRIADDLIAAQKLGVSVVGTFTGSSLWAGVTGYPHNPPELIEEGFRDFAERWNPILDVCAETGTRLAAEVHPGQIAFDLVSAERAVEALEGREEFGFNFDPSHVHIKDIAMRLNGRNGLLNGYLPPGDPRRGWDFRAPGHGGVDWENLMRALNDISYAGPLSIEYSDPGIDREHGVAEACQFVKRLDYPARANNF